MKNIKTYLIEKIPQDKKAAIELSKYFEENKITDNIPLTEYFLTIILTSMLRDFKDYKIDLETLSYYCTKIWCLFIESDNKLRISRIGNTYSNLLELETEIRYSPAWAGAVLDKALKKYLKN